MLDEMFISSKDTATHRVCSVCGDLKHVKEFYKDGTDNLGKIRYRRDCRECYKKARLHEAELKRRKGGQKK